MENKMRKKKNITFSTRWTKTMDNAINDLSDVMMISKQDLVLQPYLNIQLAKIKLLMIIENIEMI